MAGSEHQELRDILREIISKHTTPEGLNWLEGQVKLLLERLDIGKFNSTFVMMPRKTGKLPIDLTQKEQSAVQENRKGLVLKGWTCDRLARVWLLMHLPAGDQSTYIQWIETLFLNAEMNELIALYSALPVLAYPEVWRKRCAEGIRSNIGQVLESIMCNNPYPGEQLDEAAWNQLVLKAIFTDKPLLQIQGLKERANDSLAHSISWFAHERWAAGRQVNPLVWICVVDFVDAEIFADIQRLAWSTDSAERKAAALVCSQSAFEESKTFLEKNAELNSLINTENISWLTLEKDLMEQNS
jgi:hypothetical protein